LIGDIHGHADELHQLLKQMGYEQRRGVHQHPERKVIFLGDFIDRGPRIRQVLETVRAMVDAGHALAVMGNHEWNALAYHTPDPRHANEYLRRHTPKNERQHARTMEQLSASELQEYLRWFQSLPMWLEPGGLRAVHACWDDDAVANVAMQLAEHGGIDEHFLSLASSPAEPLFAAVETLLKGKEAPLPAGVVFQDKDGNRRRGMRTRWYLPAVEQTYRSYAFQATEIDCDLTLEPAIVAAARPYAASHPPVFVGHYWLTEQRPRLLSNNVACLDFSVAKGGFLCAYRWQGEQTLTDDHFCTVASV
jgi:hypothetical protein